MNLKQQMKWRLNDLLALDGSEASRKSFFSEFTQPCAHDIMTAPAGSPLTGLRRQRRTQAKQRQRKANGRFEFSFCFFHRIFPFFILTENRL